MLIIHCADLHLDSRLSTNLSKELASDRRRELTENFKRLTDYAAEQNVRAVLICGDMFDTGRVTKFTENMVLNSIKDHPGISFYLLKGNHDSESFIDELSDIPDNLFLFDDSWKEYDLDGIKIHGVELTSANSQSVQQNFAPDPSKVNIVMLHGQEAETASKDKAETINLRLFKNKGINYLALGHVHEYKSCELDSMARYCYPGCLEARGFDEPGDHGFVLLDVDTETGSVKDSFVSFAKRKVYLEQVDISGLNNTFDIAERVKETLHGSEAQSKDMVKVILTGEVDVECEKDLRFIAASIGDDYYFSKVSDETKLKVSMESYINDMTLKGEFVRTVMADESLSDDRKAAIVRTGLELFSEVRS
ncbi:MAG: DNA repair exonuclease [Lachnospiraceae bacterium]|nr:DNA repair exonuclease [Lachnospiraceae bacterium]